MFGRFKIEIASRAKGAVEQSREDRLAMRFGSGFQQQEAVAVTCKLKIGTFDSKANGLILLAGEWNLKRDGAGCGNPPASCPWDCPPPEAKCGKINFGFWMMDFE
jgi:hypothetical protein